MRTIAVMVAFAMLVAVGCGGKADKTVGSKGTSVKVAPGMQLVSLKLPAMT